MSPEPVGLEPFIFGLFVAIVIVMAVTMLWVVWRDLTISGVDPDALTGVWIGACALILLTGDASDWSEAMAMGCIVAGITDIVRLWQPLAIGQGDIWMMGLIGFMAGPDHAALVLFAFGIFCILTATAYGVARRKTMLHVVFPVTAPGMGAAALAMALWLNDLAGWRPLPAGYDVLRLAGYQVPPFLILASLCWAIGLGFIVMNRKRIGIWKGAAT